MAKKLRREKGKAFYFKYPFNWEKPEKVHMNIRINVQNLHPDIIPGGQIWGNE